MASPVWSSSARYPPREANAFEVYVDGQEAFAAIAQAIASAKQFVYATFAYVDLDFRMRPEEPTTLLALLQSRAAAGIDVRILIWDPYARVPGTIRDPAEKNIDGINAGRGSIQARWDRAAWRALGVFGCHHQKTFVVDGRRAFVGGINATQAYWDTPGHDPSDIRRVPFTIPRSEATDALKDYPPLHDLFAGFQGPSVSDVESNFVERWNQATFRHPSQTRDATTHPVPGPAGSITLQVTRTIAKGQYPTVPDGERSIYDSYIRAIDAAAQSIYFENQYFYDHGVDEALERAAGRGVKVIGLMARRPDRGQLQGVVETVRESLGNASLLLRRSLRRSQVALYCPLVTHDDPSKPSGFAWTDIYVHAKLLVVDGSFLTLGSANISSFSMDFHSELNVIANDASVAAALLRRLWGEHFANPKISEELFSNAKRI